MSDRCAPKPRPIRSRARRSPRSARRRSNKASMASGRCGPARPRRLGQRFRQPSSRASSPRTHWRSSLAERRGSPMEIVAVPAFSDNYIWLVHDEESGETAVVDPGDAAPALAETERLGWTIDQIWNTHWHPDHTGGNLVIKDATGARISGPASGRIPGRDVALSEGDEVRLGKHVGRVIEVPGHTLDHIALIFDEDRVAFVGDTLFAMGCGRLFEGTPQQMYRSLQRLAELPADAR